MLTKNVPELSRITKHVETKDVPFISREEGNFKIGCLGPRDFLDHVLILF